MNYNFNEKNYRHVMGRLKDHKESLSKNISLTRGSLKNAVVSAHANNSNNRHFLRMFDVLECIEETSIPEDKLYSILYTAIKQEYDRAKQAEANGGEHIYDSVTDVEIGVSREDLKFRLKAKDPTIRKYFCHLEELGLITIYRNFHNKIESIKCNLDLEIINPEEITAVLNFVARNNKVYREMTLADYALLDMYLDIDSKAEIDKLRKSKKSSRKNKEDENVSETYSNILFGNFDSDDSNLEQSERLEEVDKSGVKGVENEKNGEIVPLTEEIARAKAKEKIKEEALTKVKEKQITEKKQITERDIMFNDRKKDKDRKEYEENLAFEKENAESIANPEEDMVDLNELVDWWFRKRVNAKVKTQNRWKTWAKLFGGEFYSWKEKM